jgi:hypothetical protein
MEPIETRSGVVFAGSLTPKFVPCPLRARRLARFHLDERKSIFVTDVKILELFKFEKVWRLNAGDGSSPIQLDASELTPVNIFEVTAAKVCLTLRRPDRLSFQEKIIDISTGHELLSWESDTEPESFSSDGRFAALVTLRVDDVEIHVVDASNGVVSRTLELSSTHKPKSSNHISSVMVRFLADHRLLVIPNAPLLERPNLAGFGIQIFDASSGDLITQFFPEYFRPSGYVAVSGDGNTFVIDSVYASEKSFALDSANAKDVKPSIFIFSGLSEHLQMTIPDMYVRLPFGRGQPLRLSENGSVLGLADSSKASVRIYRSS